MSRLGVGEKFGYLLIKNKKKQGWRKETQWLCECVCGKTGYVNHFKLFYGQVTSCGCKTNESVVDFSEEKKKETPEARVYKDIIQRCCNPRDKNYSRYGAKGISVCKEWLNSFDQFVEDVGARPSESHSLCRYNTKLGYDKDNCAWMTRSEQTSRNNKRSKVLTN